MENLQVVQLVLGALFACLAAKKAFTRDVSNIWYCGAVISLICAGRELNWGRVFYPLADHNDFVPLKELSNYSTVLRSISSGMASFEMVLHSYRILDEHQTRRALEDISGVVY